MYKKKQVISVVISLLCLSILAFAVGEEVVEEDFPIPVADPGFGCSIDPDCWASFTTDYTCVSGICKKVSSQDLIKSQEETQAAVAAQAAETQAALEQSAAQTAAALEQQKAETKKGLSSVETEIASVKANVAGVETALKSEINSGLAALQQSTDSRLVEVEQLLVEEKEAAAFRRNIWMVIIGLLAAAIIIMVIMRKKEISTRQNQLHHYINYHIRKGVSLEDIKKKLLKIGWSSEEIIAAHHRVKMSNYKAYKNKTATKKPAVSVSAAQKQVAAKQPSRQVAQSVPPAQAANPKKMMLIMIIGVVVLLGFFIVLQKTGVLAGHAIAFGDLSSSNELGTLVLDTLQQSLGRSEFFPLLSSLNLCVQVESDVGSVSYVIGKTGQKATITQSRVQCENTRGHDLAVKFTDGNTFNTLSKSITCGTLVDAHQRQRGQLFRGMVVLPSAYVEPGFSFSGKNPSPYCNALLNCFELNDLGLAGINCGPAIVGSRPVLEGQAQAAVDVAGTVREVGIPTPAAARAPELEAVAVVEKKSLDISPMLFVVPGIVIILFLAWLLHKKKKK